MKTTKAAIRYAKAFIELAVETQKADRIAEDMEFLAKVSAENKDFRNLLDSPIVKVDKKMNIFNELFHSFDELTMLFIRLITKNRRETMLDEIAHGYLAQLKEIKGIQSVTISSAHPLDDATRKVLIDKVQKSVPEKKLAIEEVIDTELIGGFIVKMGDIQIDASVSNQLARMKQRMLN